jgi:hypothetical protein
MLELQAPQGPYTNVLDLQVFPAMSKRHYELLRVFSNTEADKDRIWKIANEIWNTMTSSMVARAFLLAYRIMRKIFETKGDTDWLKTEKRRTPLQYQTRLCRHRQGGLKNFRTSLGWLKMNELEASQCTMLLNLRLCFISLLSTVAYVGYCYAVFARLAQQQ